MAYAVDWAIRPPQLRSVVEADDQSSPRLGGVCVTGKGAVVVTEPAAERVRWTEPNGGSFVLGGTPGLVDGRLTTARFRRHLGVAAGPDGATSGRLGHNVDLVAGGANGH